MCFFFTSNRRLKVFFPFKKLAKKKLSASNVQRFTQNVRFNVWLVRYFSKYSRKGAFILKKRYE